MVDLASSAGLVILMIKLAKKGISIYKNWNIRDLMPLLENMVKDHHIDNTEKGQIEPSLREMFKLAKSKFKEWEDKIKSPSFDDVDTADLEAELDAFIENVIDPIVDKIQTRLGNEELNESGELVKLTKLFREIRNLKDDKFWISFFDSVDFVHKGIIY